MSIRAYCAMKGFAENTYYYWQRRLRDVAAAQLESVPASLPAPQFAEVALVPAAKASAAAAQTGQLHVQIRNIETVTISKTEYEALVASKEHVTHLERQVEYLLAQMRLSRHKQFGESSEKSEYDPQQLNLFNEAEVFADAGWRFPTTALNAVSSLLSLAARTGCLPSRLKAPGPAR